MLRKCVKHKCWQTPAVSSEEKNKKNKHFNFSLIFVSLFLSVSSKDVQKFFVDIELKIEKLSDSSMAAFSMINVSGNLWKFFFMPIRNGYPKEEKVFRFKVIYQLYRPFFHSKSQQMKMKEEKQLTLRR